MQAGKTFERRNVSGTDPYFSLYFLFDGRATDD